MKENGKENTNRSKASQTENQVQAVFALFKGEKVKIISDKFGISRSRLYQLRRRAIEAVRREIENPSKNKKKSSNRIIREKEEKIVSLCQRYPTWSSYQISDRLKETDNETITPRTIQRVRKRNCLPRLTKRPPPTEKAHSFTDDEKDFIRQKIKDKLFLGGERLAWDLQNRNRIKISPSTVKRMKKEILLEMNPPPPKPEWQFYERRHPHRLWHGDLMEKVTLTDEDMTAYQLTLSDDYSRTYVFCDLFREVTVNTTIKAIIAAMRKFQTIPHALIFDNGTYFKGKLLQEFCRRLGIRLIHTAVNHPQTNGKLERGFRDDMKEFYRLFDEWNFSPLKKKLPEYVEYRNTIRGHHALQGKPSSVRLAEQDFFALPYVLNNLEKFAWCERQPRTVGRDGLLRLYQRDIYINPKLAGQKIKIFETLTGLEAEDEMGKLYFLPDYKELICRPIEKYLCGTWIKDTRVHYFRQIYSSKRLETLNQILRVEKNGGRDKNG